ncbi:hypothetical protein ACHAW6_001097, partial [Cyclotella cf. meneghiniana]
TFKVKTCAILPFGNEVVLTAPVVAPAAQEDVTDQHLLMDGVTPDIHGELVQEVAELHQQGIEADNDNQPAPENASIMGSESLLVSSTSMTLVYMCSLS